MNADTPLPPPAPPATRNGWKIFGIGVIVVAVLGIAVGVGITIGSSDSDSSPTTTELSATTSTSQVSVTTAAEVANVPSTLATKTDLLPASDRLRIALQLNEPTLYEEKIAVFAPAEAESTPVERQSARLLASNRMIALQNHEFEVCQLLRAGWPLGGLPAHALEDDWFSSTFTTEEHDRIDRVMANKGCKEAIQGS